MRARLALLPLLMCVVFAGPAQAQFSVPDPAPGEEFQVELGLMFWKPTPTLLIQTDALAAIGENEIDFAQEFGFDEKTFREFRAVLKVGRKHKVRFSYVPLHYDAEAVLQRTITFGGRTFDVGLDASADVTWDLWRFGYEWDFVAGERGLVGFVFEGKYNKVTADLTSSIGSELADAKALVPTLGIIGRGYVHRNVSITTEFTGFKLPGLIADRFREEGEDFDAKMTDFDIYATASFSRHFGIQGGYRWLTADYLIDEDSGDLTMKGMYFGAMIRF